MKSVVTLFAHRVLPGLIFLMGLGCGSTNRLHEVDFEDARVAVVANIPPRPVVFTDVFYEARIDPDDPVGSIFRAGTAIAKQAEARQAQVRMDSALAYVDVADRVARQTLRRSAPTLGYRPTNHPEDADFILDLHIANYGLVADSWEAAVHFELDAEMLLVDRRTRRVIWKKRLREVEPVSHAGIGLGATFGNVFTAAALSTLSVEEMVVALEHLADFTAARFAAILRHDYYVSRGAGESESRGFISPTPRLLERFSNECKPSIRKGRKGERAKGGLFEDRGSKIEDRVRFQRALPWSIFDPLSSILILFLPFSRSPLPPLSRSLKAWLTRN